MSQSKIQIKVGIVEFLGEGEPDWLSGQLDKILLKIPELSKIELPSNNNEKIKKVKEDNDESPAKGKGISNLASFLRERNATVSQVKKFLATSAFLQFNGKKRLSTSDVNDALKNANQSRLGNASDCLLQNINKGFCERDGGKEFFVTSNGLVELGLEG